MNRRTVTAGAFADCKVTFSVDDEMHAIHAKQLADDVARREPLRLFPPHSDYEDAARALVNQPPPDARWCIRYHLRGYPQETTPEPAEGAMHDRNLLIGMGATHIEVVEVKA